MRLAEALRERCCFVCGVSVEVALSSSRELYVVLARHMLFYMLRNAGYTWSMCGRVVNRDHATAMYGARNFSNLLDAKDIFAVRVWERLHYEIWGGADADISPDMYCRIFKLTKK